MTQDNSTKVEDFDPLNWVEDEITAHLRKIRLTTGGQMDQNTPGLAGLLATVRLTKAAERLADKIDGTVDLAMTLALDNAGKKDVLSNLDLSALKRETTESDGDT